MRIWKVTYEDLEVKAGRRPFWKLTDRIQADTSLVAIWKIKAMFPPPRYGNYKASVAK